MGNKTHSEKNYQINPIGSVRRENDRVLLNIEEDFLPGLAQLAHFSHVIVLWWADKHDNEESRTILQTLPPYADDKLTGVFACRSEYRPNPIALTVCKILEVDEQLGKVVVGNIEALVLKNLVMNPKFGNAGHP